MSSYQEALGYEAFVRNIIRIGWCWPCMCTMISSATRFYLVENGFGRPYFRLVNGALKKCPTGRARIEENYREIQRRFSVRWYHRSQFYNALRQL